jgi:Xaa-Pro aminopeptidase
MTLCVESYAGEVGGPDGVKLEEMVLITETGVEFLGLTPYEESWL